MSTAPAIPLSEPLITDHTGEKAAIAEIGMVGSLLWIGPRSSSGRGKRPPPPEGARAQALVRG